MDTDEQEHELTRAYSPRADPNWQHGRAGGGAEAFRQQVAAADSEGRGQLAQAQLTALLQGLQPQLSTHQAISVFRRLPKDETQLAALLDALST